MNDLVNTRNPCSPLRARPLVKLENANTRNTNHIKFRFKLEAPLVIKDPKECIIGFESHKKPDLTPSNPSTEKNRIVPIRKINLRNGEFTNRNMSDGDKFTFDSRRSSAKHKETTKLPEIKMNINLDRSFLDPNSFSIFNDSGLVNDSLYRRIDPSQLQKSNRYVIASSRNSYISKEVPENQENSQTKERNSSSRPKTRHRIKLSGVEQPTKRALSLQEGNNLPKEIEENKEILESHKTLTSVFNSNQALRDLSSFDWDEEADSEKIIKQVVGKHVENAHKNIKMIKKNFHKRSKTFLFYVEKDK